MAHNKPIDQITVLGEGKGKGTVNNFVGFYDFEIEKAERNLKIFLDRSTISTEEVKTNELNFVKYLDQHDFRRNTSFRNTFPELYNVYKSIGK